MLLLLKQIIKAAMGARDCKFALAERAFGLFYDKSVIGGYGKLAFEDSEFRNIYKKLHGSYTRSYERKYMLAQLLKLVPRQVKGDAAECGVFTGGSSFFIAKTLDDSTVFLFDSFEGLSEPGTNDGAYWKKNDMRTSRQIAESNLSEFKNVVFMEGWIPTRFNEVENSQFKFVHIDVDLYEPTRQSLEFFYKRMVQGGIMLFDDYGLVLTCPGAKKACDEFFSDKPEQIVSLTTGQGFIVKQ